MRTSHWSGTILIAAFALAMQGYAIAGQEKGADRPNLGGQWQLNEELSENAQEKMQSIRGQRGGGGGAGGMGGMGGHGGMGGQGGMGAGRSGQSPEDRERMQEAMRTLMEAPSTITIVQDEPKISITDGAGRVRTLYTDGRKLKSESGDGGEVQTKWNGSKLSTETKVGDGLKIVETYELAPSGRQLVVNRKMEVSRMGRSMSVRSVYDGTAGSGPSI